MPDNNETITKAQLFSFKDLFDEKADDNDVTAGAKVKEIVIPMIQRDYAQGRNDSATKRKRNDFLDLLLDIVNDKETKRLDLIYGKIENKKLTPLDGQQRLTALFLLYWYAAKKERKSKTEWEKFKNFKYETRYNAKRFCEKLYDEFDKITYFDPISPREKNISEYIEDQNWFPLQWKKDPTISSMLVVLDSIDEKFHDVTNLLDKLNKIKFYYYPLEDVKDADKLYINMNSRGKELTTYEILKADLEKYMRESSYSKTDIIMQKFDGIWTDFLWDYCDKNTKNYDAAIPDEMFVNYFKYICYLIHYRDNNEPFDYSLDEFDLAKKYFSKGCTNAHAQNMDFLENAFDCWIRKDNNSYDYKKHKEFLENYMSSTNNNDGKKIVVKKPVIESDKKDKKYENMLHNCLVNGTKVDYSVKVLLYAIMEFLKLDNKNRMLDNKNDDEFIKRLRWINNLVNNSNDELAERVKNSHMQAIFKQTQEIMTTGKLYGLPPTGFNETQLEEEKQKEKYLDKIQSSLDYNDNDKLKQLRKLEDHPLLNGQISILVGKENLVNTDVKKISENIAKVDKFYKLFEKSDNYDYALISRAMMTFDDYGQINRKGTRFYYGVDNYGSWEELFQQSNDRKGFEKTGEILNTLLDNLGDPATADYKGQLEKIINDYISVCTSKKEYPWRYYFIAYYDLFKSDYGHYRPKKVDTSKKVDTFKDANDYISAKDKFYDKMIMKNKTNISNDDDLPFDNIKNVIKEERLKSASDGDEKKKIESLFANVQITWNSKGFDIGTNDPSSSNKTITIKQNNDIDAEDRIAKLKDELNKWLNEQLKNNAQN